MTAPNPAMLRWAREKAGLSIEEAAQRLSLKSRRMSGHDILIGYESGSASPSSKKLEEIAKLYRRPLLTFFLSSPPVSAVKGEDFRTLPDAPSTQESASLDALIRDVYVRQNIIREALIDSDVAESIDYINSISLGSDINQSSEIIKRITGISTEEYRSMPTAHESFNYLRKKIENIGTYVLLIGNLGTHHSNISSEIFRGFAISDRFAPFIVINDNDSKFAWCFTLLHELVHIFLGKSGVSNFYHENQIEKFCNDIASDILLSNEEFNSIGISGDKSLDEIIEIASTKSLELNISSSMIIYRTYVNGIINFNEWQKASSHFKRIWFESKSSGSSSSGGSYYTVKKHKTGTALINTVKRSILDGVMTQTKAGKVLGVKPGNVAEMVGL